MAVNKLDERQWCVAKPARYLSLSSAQIMGHTPIPFPNCGRKVKLRKNIYGTPLGLPAHKNINWKEK